MNFWNLAECTLTMTNGERNLKIPTHGGQDQKIVFFPCMGYIKTDSSLMLQLPVRVEA